jgi:hypothetical protein
MRKVLFQTTRQETTQVHVIISRGINTFTFSFSVLLYPDYSIYSRSVGSSKLQVVQHHKCRPQISRYRYVPWESHEIAMWGLQDGKESKFETHEKPKEEIHA